MLKTRSNSQESLTQTRTLLVVAPILPGKTEAWRRFMQEMAGTRQQEYQVSRRRLGIQMERAWISETRQKTIGVILIEAEHLDQTLATLVSSDHPFDSWFREQLLILQGLDLSRFNPTFLPDLVFAWQKDDR